MTLLEQLQNILKPGHTLTIKALDKDCWFRTWNKTSKDVKHVYNIHINAVDSKAGQGFVEHEYFTLQDIMPSKLLDYYYGLIEDIFKSTNHKLHITCSSECGKDIEYQVVWNKNR